MICDLSIAMVPVTGTTPRSTGSTFATCQDGVDAATLSALLVIVVGNTLFLQHLKDIQGSSNIFISSG